MQKHHLRAKSLQLCPTFCDPVDCSPPGSSPRGILQARTLEWVAIPFSRQSSRPRDRTQVSCVSCFGCRFFTASATWEAQKHHNCCHTLPLLRTVLFQNCTFISIFSFLHHHSPTCSVQFSSVAQSCPTLCDSMHRSTPGLPVHHRLPGFTQTHVCRVCDAIQPSHPLSSPSPPAPNPSQHQSLTY